MVILDEAVVHLGIGRALHSILTFAIMKISTLGFTPHLRLKSSMHDSRVEYDAHL